MSQGACLAINAGKWLECLEEICAYHDMSSPSDDERLPVGTGSNPVSVLNFLLPQVSILFLVGNISFSRLVEMLTG